MSPKAYPHQFPTNETKNEETKSTFFLNLSQYITMFLIAFMTSLAVFFAMRVIGIHLSVAKDDSLILPHQEEQWIIPTRRLLIKRQEWGAKPASNTTDLLQLPVDLVIITHTATNICWTFEKCSQIVASIQDYHLNTFDTDIAYNFLIGGDGNIYEGRGWDAVNFQRNQSLSVSFIGNFVFEELKMNMIEAFQELMTEGVESEKLTMNYKIVCHNQTKATSSPGRNVYKIVKTWSHFAPGNLN